VVPVDNHFDEAAAPPPRAQARGGLIFKAHILLYHSTLGLRVMKKKNKMVPVHDHFDEAAAPPPRAQARVQPALRLCLYPLPSGLT